MASLVTGCLDDLPQPSQCPADAQHEVGDCSPAIVKVTEEGIARCLQPDETACLAGTEACSCLSGSCPVTEDACFPPPDCPPAVRERYPDAECIRLEPLEIGLGTPSEVQCMCGCAGCAAVCDGRGPVFGVLDTGGDLAFLPPTFEVRRHLPDQGTFGIYLRVRGLASMGLALFSGQIDLSGEVFDVTPLNFGPDWPHGTPYVLSPLSTEFVEHVVVDQKLLEVPAYTWTSADRRPDYAMLLPGGSMTDPALSLYELDCAVPFVLPP